MIDSEEFLCRCAVCENPVKSYLDSMFDDRYGFPGSFSLFRCPDCKHISVQLKASSEMMKDLYSNYYPRSGFDLKQHEPSKETFGFKSWLDGNRCSAFRWVPRNVRVLDIGCGFGETLGYHQARGCEVFGVEADENIRRVADRFGYQVHVGLFDASLYQRNYFDYVTMDQVIEHVMTPLDFMWGVTQILKPGGHVILSTPNANGWGFKCFGRRWINWHIPYHLQFFSYRSLQIAAGKAGLLIEQCRTITSSEWLFYQWLHLVTFPKMGQPSGFWSPKGKLTLNQKIAFKLISIFHKTKINHMLTRIFDGLKLGDNYVFILRKPL